MSAVCHKIDMSEWAAGNAIPDNLNIRSAFFDESVTPRLCLLAGRDREAIGWIALRLGDAGFAVEVGGYGWVGRYIREDFVAEIKVCCRRSINPLVHSYPIPSNATAAAARAIPIHAMLLGRSFQMSRAASVVSITPAALAMGNTFDAPSSSNARIRK